MNERAYYILTRLTSWSCIRQNLIFYFSKLDPDGDKDLYWKSATHMSNFVFRRTERCLFFLVIEELTSSRPLHPEMHTNIVVREQKKAMCAYGRQITAIK